MSGSEPTNPKDSFAPVAEKYLTSAAHAKPDALNALVARIEPTGGLVVDVGTGAGHTAYAFAPKVDRLVAVDITQEMLDIVKREAKTRGLTNITTELAPAEKLPLKSEQATGVVTRLAAHHFDDVAAFVSECARVLEPGGWLLVVDTVGPEDEEIQAELDHIERLRDPSHGHDLAVSEWGALVDANGFSTEWVDVTRKSLDLEDWLERMEVPENRRPTLRELILESEGALRKYLSPTVGPKSAFDLWEMSLFARKA
ncbi:MAG: class I SAM-dependent methyltransferase [Fimbriimonadaceae bacterium]